MHLNLGLQEGYDIFLKFKEILLHFIFSFTVQKSKTTKTSNMIKIQMKKTQFDEQKYT